MRKKIRIKESDSELQVHIGDTFKVESITYAEILWEAGVTCLILHGTFKGREDEIKLSIPSEELREFASKILDDNGN